MLHRSMAICLVAAAVAYASVASACGGDSKDEDTPTEAASLVAAAQRSPTRASPTRIPATAVPATGPALAISSKGKTPFVPTVDEFRALPKTTVKGQQGVSITALVEKAGFTAATVATIDGVAPVTNNEGAIRYALKDIGATTILAVDDTGHLRIVSDTIPEPEWLTLVTSITLE